MSLPNSKTPNDSSDPGNPDTSSRLFKNQTFDRWQHFRHTGFFPNSFTHSDNKILLLENPAESTQLPTPPPEIMQYGESEQKHFASGKRDYEFLNHMLSNNNVAIDQFDRILDFGCSNGRVLRHFEPLTNKLEGWGCDLNANSLLWCVENLSPPFRFFVNTTTPHLPLEDKYFGFVFCFSIFTHIDDLFVTWLLELRRVLQSGGYLFVSIHDEKSVTAIKKNPENFLHSYYQKNDLIFEKFLEGKINFVSINRDVRSMVFIRRDYFKNVCQQYFELIDLAEGAMGGSQSGFLLKKH